MKTKEELAKKLAPKIKDKFNLFPIFTPNVYLSEVAIGMKNNG